MKNKVALLVHSCDRYELLYKGFEYFFNQNWDYSIPCTYYFATEEKSATVGQFSNIKSGKGEWSNRLAAILNQVQEEYILYFQEDMWLNKPVSKGFFTELFNLAITNNWNQVKLNSSGIFKTEKGRLTIEGLNVSKLKNDESDFLMSHQVTLWNKKFLLQQLKPNEHPWRNERKGTKRLKKLNPEILHIDYFAEHGHSPINQNQALNSRSEYYCVSINGTLNPFALPFIDKLKTEPELAAYAEKLSYNYHNDITHDGKPRPLKKDIFKRLKDWFLKR
ncbi:hypothetical protein [Pontibacter sp. SGAir0037]|uniref:hypothetical protein n=1 Tax=Pontibacter sp. SGAir0037 TaxID=2571030 RepID=UPI0010CCFE24|nr:hypothetical protein [Pontibacter sp. SGAir0037]QCR23318.1 hypothetical protein C1N53_13870 [Pontibacter sp. SGAir0037]